MNKLSAYIRLARLDKPVGIWLLFIPCCFGLLLAQSHDPILFLLFFIGSVVMRSAGCVLNDILDRDIDAEVERTKNRPLASGELTPKKASIFLAGLLLIGFLVLISLNLTAIILGFLALPLVALYPKMKRITYYPQAFLGITFNWGVLVGYAAATGEIGITAIIMYIGCIFWTLAYDTIYALQDIEDDQRIGINSTAITFGKSWKGLCAAFYIIFIALFILASGFSLLTPIAFIMLFWQLKYANPRYPRLCLGAFKNNIWVGLVLILSLV